MWIPGGVLTVPALFVVGAASSVHCALMCGALSAAQGRLSGGLPANQGMVLVHGGRIVGYTLLGAFAGALGARVLSLLPASGIARWLQGFAALALIAVGAQQLYAALRRRAAGLPECCSVTLPQSARHLPRRVQCFLRGMAWALVPCGLLYSILMLAVFSASAVSGALLLAAFAAGSAPLLALVGTAGSWRPRRQRLTQLGGALMIALGAATLLAVADPALAKYAAWCQIAR